MVYSNVMYLVLMQCIMLHSVGKMAGRSERARATVRRQRDQTTDVRIYAHDMIQCILTRPVFQIPILPKIVVDD